jgi:hypothetical protein
LGYWVIGLLTNVQPYKNICRFGYYLSRFKMILEELEVYKLALEISKLAWEIYNKLPQEHRFTQGRQSLEAADSSFITTHVDPFSRQSIG